jgi:hypothetical protein
MSSHSLPPPDLLFTPLCTPLPPPPPSLCPLIRPASRSPAAAIRVRASRVRRSRLQVKTGGDHAFQYKVRALHLAGPSAQRAAASRVSAPQPRPSQGGVG